MTGRLLSVKHQTCSGRDEVDTVVTQTWSQKYGGPENRDATYRTIGWQRNTQGLACGWDLGPSGPPIALDHGN